MLKRTNAGRGAIGALLLTLLATCCWVSAQGPAALPVLVAPHGNNAPAQQEKPYVILVSLDGFRFDYAQRYGAQNLQAMARRGASAPQGMIPVFPSVTFPNHYSIVTGLYPEHHGIVGNSFYDPARQQHFVYTDRRPAPTEAGMAACRCGCWPNIRACAPPASSGPARRAPSAGSGPRTTSCTIRAFPTKRGSTRWSNGCACRPRSDRTSSRCILAMWIAPGTRPAPTAPRLHWPCAAWME